MYEKIVEINPNNVNALVLLGRCAIIREEFNKALNTFNIILKLYG